MQNRGVALGTVVHKSGFVLTKASELHAEPVCVLRDGRELREHRLVGFADANAFGALLDAVGAN